MIIYQNTKAGYINDVDSNSLKDILVESFKSKTGGVPDDSRVWADEYRAFSRALDRAKVDPEIQVAIEYHLSAIGRFRIDVLLAGNDGNNDNGLIMELKAWDKAELSNIRDMVLAPGRGGMKPKSHPCSQAQGYRGLILNFNQSVADNQIGILSAAYLFNMRRRDPEPLEDERYSQILAGSRLFLADDFQSLQRYLEEVVPQKPQKQVFWILENGVLRPSKELVLCVGQMLEGNPEFELIDEQKEAFEILRHEITSKKYDTERHVFIVQGGPGTGKSVIAVQLLAEIISKKRMGCFVAPNAAFRKTLIEYLAQSNSGWAAMAKTLFRSSWNFHDADFKKDKSNDVLIIDEAHRLKNQAQGYYGKNMVDDLVRAARISIFLIDEDQRIAWNDIGSIAEIAQAAERHGATLHEPMELSTQFRCNGSSGYLNWLDDVLQIRETGNYDNWGNGQYDFRVFVDAGELYQALKEQNGDNKARLIAGYAWEWPTKGRGRSGGATHVKVGDLELPWNYDGENWATAQDGIGQVGCIHTCQGLEFDWVGIFIGDDLSFDNDHVIGKPKLRAKTDRSLHGWQAALMRCNRDPEKEAVVYAKIQQIIKGTYKVLLTRGKKGCFVWCKDPALGTYFRQRLNSMSNANNPASG